MKSKSHNRDSPHCAILCAESDAVICHICHLFESSESSDLRRVLLIIHIGLVEDALRFVFLDYVGLRIEFREYLYGKQRNKGLGTASEFTLGVSFLL